MAMCCMSLKAWSDSPHFQQGEQFTDMSERVTRREGFTPFHDTVSDSVRGHELGWGVGLDMNDLKGAPSQGLVFFQVRPLIISESGCKTNIQAASTPREKTTGR